MRRGGKRSNRKEGLHLKAGICRIERHAFLVFIRMKVVIVDGSGGGGGGRGGGNWKRSETLSALEKEDGKRYEE